MNILELLAKRFGVDLGFKMRSCLLFLTILFSLDSIASESEKSNSEYLSAQNQCGVEQSVVNMVMVSKILGRQPKDVLTRVKQELSVPGSGAAGLRMAKNDKWLKKTINTLYKTPFDANDIDPTVRAVYLNCINAFKSQNDQRYEELK